MVEEDMGSQVLLRRRGVVAMIALVRFFSARDEALLPGASLQPVRLQTFIVSSLRKINPAKKVYQG